MKKIITKIAYISLLSILSISIAGCSKKVTFNTHTQEQQDFLSGSYKYISKFAKGAEEKSKPVPVKLSWSEFGDNNYEFYLSKDKDFTNIERNYQTNSNYVDINNLEINTNYYWYVTSNNQTSKVSEFVIDTLAPRSLDIEGLTNARDLGGYKTINGKYTNQGLIYRTSRLNENETTDNLITEQGILEMKNNLKIKSELDLRKVSNNENGGITSSPLGEDVNYYSLPMSSGGNIILLNKNSLKDAFKILGNKDNYPLVIHCSIGTDRTGMICFLINALLEVGEEELYKDYLYSNFGNIGGSRSFSTIDTYIKTINQYGKGSTLKEKTISYLTSDGINVDVKDIESLIEIMTK